MGRGGQLERDEKVAMELVDEVLRSMEVGMAFRYYVCQYNFFFWGSIESYFVLVLFFFLNIYLSLFRMMEFLVLFMNFLQFVMRVYFRSFPLSLLGSIWE